jgi:hypothetical protein
VVHRFFLPAPLITSHIFTAQVPDAVGTWMFHCHVNEHLNAGMRTLYRVDGTDDQEAPGTVRQYFVQVRARHLFNFDAASLQYEARNYFTINSKR